MDQTKVLWFGKGGVTGLRGVGGCVFGCMRGYVLRCRSEMTRCSVMSSRALDVSSRLYLHCATSLTKERDVSHTKTEISNMKCLLDSNRVESNRIELN
ncbi:hypothetical protein BU24DRAFT_381870 [Aaosphaeria arxii CBS 175.79]|uniref:Uncharacterized protein n=1 Tax=Aaosphaeria arxii CBS 175.79 TaxID=1450172 RepID=A0A6A5X6X2_9PLEO|nr:uncharacterized protein BU24DRAFT_381870 [Aaosphaeria arxii CBS 175.79]KAF2008534.1 hypothetical protein BU24DRAFT_381870 [Aaosphaeria arxii CBS 175.79]